MTIALREKRVGPYTVRELSMRETMKVLARFDEASPERGAALLGAAVFNGTGEPLGDSILDLGSGLYTQLMEAYTQVSGRVEFPEDERGNA